MQYRGEIGIVHRPGATSMAIKNHGMVVRGIERIFNQGSLTGEGEGHLLRQYATQGDEAAFEALVTRHGPMVLSVCRRMLLRPARRRGRFSGHVPRPVAPGRLAGGFRSAEPVASRCGLPGRGTHPGKRGPAAVRGTSRRRGRRRSELACNVEQNEIRAILDEEIHRLPEKYRRPVVLCYLEGRTQEEAARRLRCTAGSVRGRLDRAREKLRSRLVRRGLAPSAALIASALGAETASASVPLPLIAGTVSTLGRAATARAVAATGSRRRSVSWLTA